MFSRDLTIAKVDPDLWAAIQRENQRQQDHIELIASENYCSPAVMQAQGLATHQQICRRLSRQTLLRRLRIRRHRRDAGAGTHQGNLRRRSGERATEFRLASQPGDFPRDAQARRYRHGHVARRRRPSHARHGTEHVGKWFNIVSYGLNEKEEIDYDAMERLAHEKKPKLIIAGASAYSLRIDFERFAKVAKDVGAYFMVDMAHYAGLIAAGVYPNPVPHADFVTSTTHKSLRGPRGGFILMKSEFERQINSAVFPGLQGGPLMHVIAAKAVAFKEAMLPEFKTYQEQVIKNAKVLAETLIARGLRIVSGRTESHLMLVDLRGKNITGRAAETILNHGHLTCNKNAIPNDPQSPFVTSGIRLGSPAMTTRGFKEAESIKVAHLLADVLDKPEDPATLERVQLEVKKLTDAFPVYG